ncbi:hypothetical protein, partial [Lactococcus garvieae]|uniref:hypothetical protein n=2 Tax=Lactococcus garvieae TaxID=1363 RepID=UPI0023EB5B58
LYMIIVVTLFILLPFILIVFDNLTQKSYKKIKDVPVDKINLIEYIFNKVMNDIENQDFDDLKNFYSEKLLQKHIKKVTKNDVKDTKSYIKHANLEGSTDYKITNKGFSVVLSYKAISYSTFDKKRYEIYWRRIDYLFTPLGNGILGNAEDYTRFQQKWFFEERDNKFKIVKIKNYYLKTNKKTL